MNARLYLLLLTLLPLPNTFEHEAWGFFGHRRLNRLAVFTLPPEMALFYKQHIEFLTEHAVDPDKRRYATRYEAIRHYIDMDHWGEYPFEHLPRTWLDALAQKTAILLIVSGGDTLPIITEEYFREAKDRLIYTGSDTRLCTLFEQQTLSYATYRGWYKRHILPQYYEPVWTVSPDTLQVLFPGKLPKGEIRIIDHLSEHGIAPYNLERYQQKLTQAFLDKDQEAILRLSADIGHYIGDGHVPLHTTKNYNGQLSGQIGIHAFWESRIPELFADKEYDFLVGPAQYQENPQKWIWEFILESHLLVDSVLLIEADLSKEWPEDRRYCYDERLGRVIRTECPEYAKAYQDRLKGMVEARMRAAVLAIGSSWYTAWVNAGMPDLHFDQKAAPLEGSSSKDTLLSLPPVSTRQHEGN